MQKANTHRKANEKAWKMMRLMHHPVRRHLPKPNQTSMTAVPMKSRKNPTPGGVTRATLQPAQDQSTKNGNKIQSFTASLA